MKVIAILIMTLQGISVRAQTKLPIKAFYAYEYICHVSGGTAKDYVLSLFPDSTVSFTLYTQQTGNFLKRQSKTELRKTGTYSLYGDTLSVRYNPNINAFTGSSHLDSTAHSIVSRQATGLFLLSSGGETLLPLHVASPPLKLTSLVELNGRLTPANGWHLNLKGTGMHQSSDASR